MSIAVVHAVCAGMGLAPLPRLVFEDPIVQRHAVPRSREASAKAPPPVRNLR
jgi:hypothetical protein